MKRFDRTQHKWGKVKIGDLPLNFQMQGCKLNGKYIYSGWNKGFWVKDNLQNGEIKPVFFESYDAIKNWKIEISPGRMIELEVKHGR